MSSLITTHALKSQAMVLFAKARHGTLSRMHASMVLLIAAAATPTAPAFASTATTNARFGGNGCNAIQIIRYLAGLKESGEQLVGLVLQQTMVSKLWSPNYAATISESM